MSCWFAVMSLVSAAELPAPIPVQGWLSDAGGAPLAGTFVADFRIYGDPDLAPEDELWSDDLNVAFDQGRFTAMLGSDAALDANVFASDQPRWLTVSVNGGAESQPILLGYVPFAAFAVRAASAATADDAAMLGGAARAAFVEESELAVGAGLSLSGTTFSLQSAVYDTPSELTAALGSTYLRPSDVGSGLTLTGGTFSLGTAAYDTPAEVQAAVGSTYVDAAGDTMTGNLFLPNSSLGIGVTTGPDARLQVKSGAADGVGPNLFRVSDNAGQYRFRVDQFHDVYLTNASNTDTVVLRNDGRIITNMGVTSRDWGKLIVRNDNTTVQANTMPFTAAQATQWYGQNFAYAGDGPDFYGRHGDCNGGPQANFFFDSDEGGAKGQYNFTIYNYLGQPAVAGTWSGWNTSLRDGGGVEQANGVGFVYFTLRWNGAEWTVEHMGGIVRTYVFECR